MLIGSKYKVESDANNLILKALVTSKNQEDDDMEDDIKKEPGWRTVGYFYDFSELLKFMADYDIKGTGMADVKVLAKRQDEIYNLIKSLKLLIPKDFYTKPKTKALAVV